MGVIRYNVHFNYLIIIVLIFLGCSQSPKEDIPSKSYTTEYFEIHNNYWVNLHHFLYQKAKGSQLKRSQDKGKSFLSIGEEALYEGLTNEEQKTLDESIAFYKEHLIHLNLRRDLGELRVFLQQLGDKEIVSDTTFSLAYTEILNRVSKVYKAKFWPIHSQHNERILQQHLEAIERLEVGVIRDMEDLAKANWPVKDKVRVDLTVYGNWAGAYTPVRPEMNIIISTIDEQNISTLFVETVFHEGSHLLFDREDPFRSEIYFMSKEMEMDFPRGLWHACQFYLCSRVVQDHLNKIGIDHDFAKESLIIFPEYNVPALKINLEKYYRQSQDLKTTIDVILTDLKQAK